MDKSLDDIIKERKFSNPTTNKFGRGRGGGRGGFRGGGGGGGGRGGAVTSRPNRGRDGGLSTQNRGGRGRGSWKPQQQQQQQPQQKRAPISDARQKLIEKAHQGDARDRLAQKARLTDARLKLTSRRKSGEGQMAQIALPKGGGGAAPIPVAPVSRTVPNMQTQFTVRNPARVQNKTQITIRNSRRDRSPPTRSPPTRSPPTRSQQLSQRMAPSPRQANPLLAGASTLRVTKAVPQPQKRPVQVDYPHLDDDLIGQRLPNPPKVQRRMPDPPAPQERAWGYTPKMAAPVSAGTRLIISNLQITVTEDDIKELFGAIGELQKARMVRPGLAEVMYRGRTEALQAISTYHNRELDGKPMQCKLDTSTIPEAAGHRTAPNTLSDRFKTMRPENNPTLPIDTFPKGGVPSGIDSAVVTKALFKKSSSSSTQKPVVFTVKI